jgi:hypothetical protein
MSTPYERVRPAPPKSKHGMLMLQALFFTPLTLITLGGVVLALYNIAAGDFGYVVMLVVASILTILFGFQAVHYLRDMGTQPVHSEGEISKKWTKGNLFFFFMPGYYIAVKGKIFTISRSHFSGLLEEDMVRIRHYPHSLTVEFVERFDEFEKKFVPVAPDEQLS